MQVGWDWASATHDITVMDTAGQVVDRWSLTTTRPGWTGRSAGWPATAIPMSCQWRSRPPTAWSSTDCWPPAIQWSRCTQRVQRHPAPLGRRPGQVRSWWQLEAGRLPAYRRPPATPAQVLGRCHPPPAGPVTAARRPPGGQDRGHQPARRPAGCPLAGRQGHLRPPGQPDRAGLPGALPDAPGSRTAGRGPPGHVLPAPLLQRPPHPDRAAGPPARRPGLPSTAWTQGAGRLRRCPGPAIARSAGQHRRPGPDAARRLGSPSQDRRAGGHAAHRPGQLGPDPGRGRPILDRARDPEHAAAEAGASPVTKQSGKASSVHFRWAANTRTRDALATFADNSRHASPWAAGLYRQARQRGKRHPQAVRILMRAWLRVVWACWHANTPMWSTTTAPSGAPPTNPQDSVDSGNSLPGGPTSGGQVKIDDGTRCGVAPGEAGPRALPPEEALLPAVAGRLPPAELRGAVPGAKVGSSPGQASRSRAGRRPADSGRGRPGRSAPGTSHQSPARRQRHRTVAGGRLRAGSSRPRGRPVEADGCPWVAAAIGHGQHRPPERAAVATARR